MHPGSRHSIEKPKDFVGSIKRLFKELSHFRKFIYIAFIFAIASSILSIVSPNYLSKLTDEITTGLTPNTAYIETISNNITDNIKNIDLSDIMSDSSISYADKEKFSQIMLTISSSNSETIDMDNLVNNLKELPDSILNKILPTLNIDYATITTNDQLEYLTLLSKYKDISDANQLYELLDSLPNSIKSLIEPKMKLDSIKKITLILITIYLISAILSFLESILMAYVSNEFGRELRERIILKINKLPLKYFDSHEIGDTLSRITNDVDTITQSMNQSFSTLVSSITLLIGTIVMMIITNGTMALTAVVSTIIGFVLMMIVLSKSQKYFNQRQIELGKLNSHIEETYSGLLVLKTYNGKEECDKEFDKLNENVYKANFMSQFLSSLMQPLMGFIGNFGYVCVCVVGALLTMNGTITFGVIVAFMTYIRMFTSPLSQIAQAFTSLQSAGAASDRVFEFINESEMEDEQSLTDSLSIKDAKGYFEIKNIKFGYTDDKIIIKNFSAKAKPGEKIAIVGPTGAGKTTMVNLLMKFYNITDGDIIIDNHSIKNLKRENIHKLFTMVLQDTWLFNGTLRENIVFNREGITDEQVMKACDAVGLTHFVNTLPDGLDTIISDNSEVSAGQKQLITIARGMIEDAPFLILDEATSNVDTRTEEQVQKAMDKLMENRTSFIIAHRLSTIKNADLILVMNEGNIIEQGTHEELLKKNGFYAKLYNSQFEL